MGFFLKTELINDAFDFGRKAHKDQVRKYTSEPYFTHCVRVAEAVADHVDDEAAIVAALLHDTVEDTETTLDDIHANFGSDVAEYVWYLTKPPAFVGNRAKRKLHDRNRLKEAPEIVRFIKVMDVWDNYQGIREHDPKFYETFREEVRDLLYVMDSLMVVKKFAGDEFAYNKFLPWFGDL